jgi:tripartite-type tricarboxylate transporter receptor subunit TctC
MLHIPYKGSGPAVTDLLGGQVNYMFDSITSAKPHILSGKLRAIGLTTTKRSAALPNVPTLAESGLAGYEVSPWFAVFAPASTPKPIIAKLNAALLEAMKQPDIKAKFETIGAEPIGSTPEELGAHLNREINRWGKLIAEQNIKSD